MRSGNLGQVREKDLSGEELPGIPADEWKDQATRLFFGYEREGRFFLHPYELAYLREKGVLQGDPKEPLAHAHLPTYELFRRLRDEGFVVKPTRSRLLRLFPRGARPGLANAKYLVRVFSPEDSLADIVDFLELAISMRKEAVVALPDGKFLRVSYFSFQPLFLTRRGEA